jgi:hypothetical protein
MSMTPASSRDTARLTLIVVLILGYCASAWGVAFSGGDGTLGNPFQITTAQQLIDIKSDTGLLNRCFVLNNDIDFDSYYGPEGHLAGAPIAPGAFERAFEGWLDGRGHVIRRLRIKADFGDGVGLIGCVGSNGVVLSLGLEDGVVETGADEVGLLAGTNSGTILGCWVEGRVKGQHGIGLLVGTQEGGSISYSHAEGSMDARQEVGGLIGRMLDGEVLGCSADCRLEATQGQVMTCGGLIGELTRGSVDDSFARATLACPKNSSGVGGLIGHNEAGTVRACLSLGTVSSDRSTAGLVVTNEGTIRSSYSRCRVESAGTAAGLVHDNRGTVMFCYAAGVVSAADAGGLIKQGRGAFLSYWDVDRSGVHTSAGGFGRTTEQMHQAATFRGWGSQGEWILPDGEMPRLWWEPCWGTVLSDEPAHFPGGSGTVEDPYQVQTAAELASLAWDAGLLDKHFVLTQDVNLADIGADGLLPIGADGVPFCGSLDGRGHAVSGFSCDLAGNCAGLFGCVGTSIDDPNQIGVIRNLSLRQVQVAGDDVVGALAARVDGGRIERCLVSGNVQGAGTVGGAIGEVLGGEVVESAFEGTVSGSDRVGGLIGSHQGILRSCYSSGQVTGEVFAIGGLVGELGDPSGDASRTLVAFCYSQAQVQGGNSIGGLVGAAEGAEVFACYATGQVQHQMVAGGLAGAARGVVTWGSVWDRQSTDIGTSAFGQSQTTAVMKDPTTYAGWEYGGQWTLKAGSDYPRLAWEERAGPLIVDPPRPYGGGSGTRADPYLISHGEHLVTLSRHPQDFNRHFRLTKDIDLKDVQGTLSPIGTLAVPFAGSFDGNYHTLANLKHADAKAGYLGLFRSIRRSADGGAVSGLVSCLNLKGASVTAWSYAAALAAHNEGTILFCAVSESTIAADEYAGGLVAHNGPEGVLAACDSGASVTLGGVTQPEGHFMNAGGLAALNEGELLLCSSSGQVLGSRDAAPGIKLKKISENLGGLVAANRGEITGCTSTARVVGVWTIGGLVALNEGGWLRRCGTVTDIDATEYAGGLVARSAGGTISGCCARGKVAGTGLAGFIESSEDDAIESCYFKGTISGTSIGGFLGDASGQTQIRDCYCVPEILVVPYSRAFARSLSSSVQVSDCFWDKTVFAESRNMQTGSEAQRAAITGLDTESLQSGVPLREAGWDFAATWMQCAADYPRLWWEETECSE